MVKNAKQRKGVQGDGLRQTKIEEYFKPTKKTDGVDVRQRKITDYFKPICSFAVGKGKIMCDGGMVKMRDGI